MADILKLWDEDNSQWVSIPAIQGTDGQDGVSPEVTIASITGGHSVTITDADHPTGQTFNVIDGTDGQDGAPGQDGQDGVSPEVTIGTITGGHSVTITDADHPGGQTFNVMDGEDGAPGTPGTQGPAGPGVVTGGTTGQVLAKKSNTNYDTEWVTPSSGSTDIYWCIYGTTTSAQIETALAADQLPCVVRDDVVYVYAFKTSATKHYFGSTGLKTQQYLYLVEDNGTWAHNYIDIRSIPSGGNAGQLLAKNSATDYDVHWVNKTQDYPSAYCTTAAATAAKKASCSLWVDTANSYLHVLIGQANSYAGAITLNVNSTGAKPIYINGSASSATNYTLPAGSYLVFYDGTNFYFRTDGKLTANITGHAEADMSKWALLWANASPSSSFAAQTVEFSYSGYDLLMVKSRINAAGEPVVTFQSATLNEYITSWSYLDGVTRKRVATIVSSGIQFGEAVNGSSPSTSVMVPLEIYGIKGVS